MNFNRNLLSDAVRFGLAAGAVGLAGLAAAPAQAQSDEDAATLNRIEVTGSRIKRVDAETTQPVQVITRTDIEATGLTTVFDLLNNLTSSDGTGLSTVTTQTNGSDGSQQISLRGLGAGRTLVLVDGKRWITDIDATVDLSTIPLAIVERVEVLKDGASAIYGSDAIGGVINLITRKEFEGAQASTYFGQTSDGDGDIKRFDVTVGAAGERARAMVSISHSSQDAIFAGDREISQTPYFGCEALSQDPNYTVGGTLEAAIGGFCGSGFPEYGNFTVPGVGSRTLIPGRSGASPDDFRPFNNAARYNFAPVNYLQQPAKRSNIFGNASFDITDNVTATLRTTYTKRTSNQQLAEVPLTMNTNGSQGPQWTIPISGGSVFNPFGVDINASGFRMIAAGPRAPSYDYDIFSTQVGLNGFFELAGRNFDWEVFAQYNDGQYDSRGTGYINLFNLRNALGPSFRDAAGNLRCGAPGAEIRNCVPFNIFGGPDLGLGAGRITPAEYAAMVNYVSYTQVSTAGNTTNNYGGILSGELFELPGGMMGFALGTEYRRDQAFTQPDTLVASGGSSDNFSEPTVGAIRVADVFLEVVAPLLGDIPGVKSLELSAAVRNSDFKAEGQIGLNAVSPILGDPTTEKYGLRWQIIDDLMFRASWGETFRAPSVLDLFGGGRESFPQAADPCRSAIWANQPAAVQARCIAAGVPDGGVNDGRTQLRSLLGGNPFSLRPESGENVSFGFVYSPSWLDGFDLAVDYWKIELDQGITTRSATGILSGCYVTGAQPDFCNFVERAPGGLIATVRTAGFNVNSLMSEGIDLGASYRLDTDNYGRFGFKWDVTYNMATETNGVDAVGQYNGGPNWEWRSQLQTRWEMGDFYGTHTLRYVSELTEPCFIHCVANLGTDINNLPIVGGTDLLRAGSVSYHDVQVGWKTPWKGDISVGARNLFGKEPPVLQYNSFAHSFDAGYDLPGGAYYYVSYRQDF